MKRFLTFIPVACLLCCLAPKRGLYCSQASADMSDYPADLVTSSYSMQIPAIGGSTLTGHTNLYQNDIVTAGTVGILTYRDDTVPKIGYSSLGHSISTLTGGSSTNLSYISEFYAPGSDYSLSNSITTWSRVQLHCSGFVLPSFFDIGNNDITFVYKMPADTATPAYHSYMTYVPYTSSGAGSLVVRGENVFNYANQNLRYNYDYVDNSIRQTALYVDFGFPTVPDNVLFYYVNYYIEFYIEYPNDDFFSDYFDWNLLISPNSLTSASDTGYVNKYVGARLSNLSRPSEELNVLGGIFDTVSDFLQIEIFPAFTFMDILYIAVGIAIFSLLLKAFLGG